VDDDGDLADLIATTEVGAVDQECTLTRYDNNVGDHVCERVEDDKCLRIFNESNMLTKLRQAVTSRVLENYADPSEKKSILASLNGEKGNTKLSYCFSDPAVKDCPLVFVSPGFENATGYAAEFATGRSCRFLQPTSRVINDALNLKDRQLMRDFCEKPLPTGTSLVNLLINEHFNGRRYWNLLKMEHIYVDGKCYIFAVQKVVNTYMPKVLQKRARNKKLDEKVVQSLEKYLRRLNRLRADIQGSSETIQEIAAQVKTRMQEIKQKSEKGNKGTQSKKKY
jgi:hypothetical protein